MPVLLWTGFLFMTVIASIFYASQLHLKRCFRLSSEIVFVFYFANVKLK